MRWWGNSAHLWEGPPCEPPHEGPFVIKFYNSYDTTPVEPQWQTPAMTYDPVSAVVQNTYYSWTGSPELGYIYCYSVDLNPTYAPGTGVKWISIASKDVDCDFIWGPGAGGGVDVWIYDSSFGGARPVRAAPQQLLPAHEHSHRRLLQRTDRGVPEWTAGARVPGGGRHVLQEHDVQPDSGARLLRSSRSLLQSQ